MNEPQRDTRQILANLAEQKVSLELSTLDLCFMALLRLKSESDSVVAFSEEQLLDAFEHVCLGLEPGTENLRSRATHAIRRLREQRLLTRVDGAGVLRAGEFTLSALATQIVDFYTAGQALTKENLAILTRTLTLSLTEILTNARQAQTSLTWQEGVAAPLEVTVSDLVAGIEARQRGLDMEQEDFQRRIASLLNADWFGAIEQCQELLETTATTLRELNDVLLKGSQELQTLLQDLQALASDSDSLEAQRAVQHVIEQVDRITTWGTTRQRAWSEYYEYVHRYLRDVVRFDPSRALTQRLRQLLAGETGRRFSLTVAAAPPIRLLREVRPPEAPPPVRRRKRSEDTQPETSAAEPDPNRVLEEQVRALLDRGVSELSDLTRELTRELDHDERFVVAGRIARVLAKLQRPLAHRERPWVAIDDQLVIEQWQVAAKGNV